MRAFAVAVACLLSIGLAHDEEEIPEGYSDKFECDAVPLLRRGWMDGLLRKQADTFVIERNGWDSQDIVVDIARLLLLRQGYDVKVETYGSSKAKLERLKAGTVDINMEAWFEDRNAWKDYSKHTDCIPATAELGDTCVTSLGGVGYSGRSGWYLPVSGLIRSNISLSHARYFETLLKPSVMSKLLKTSEVSAMLTGDGIFSKGDCARSTDCPTLLKISKGYTPGVLERQIGSKYNITISHVGGANLWNLIGRSLDGVTRAKTPLFYWWEPTRQIRDKNHLRVNLEAASNCNTTTASAYHPDTYPCEFLDAGLLKIVNRKNFLVEEAVQIIANIEISDDAMRELLYTIDDDGLSPQEAACNWLTKNEATWNAWLTRAALFGGAGPPGQEALISAILLIITLAYILQPSIGGTAWANFYPLDRMFDFWYAIFSKCMGAIFRTGEDSRPALVPLDGKNGTTNGFAGGDGIRFASNRYFAYENDKYAEFILWRSGNVQEFVTVTVATIDGSAYAGLHYIRKEETLEFRAGEKFITFQVKLINDIYWNPSRVFSAKIVAVSGAVVARPSTATTTVFNNDPYPGSTETSEYLKVLSFFRWQIFTKPRTNVCRLLNKALHAICYNIVFPQLQMWWLTTAIYEGDAKRGLQIAAIQLFLSAVLHISTYWYDAAWAIRDETICFIAGKALTLSHDAQHDEVLFSKIKTLSEQIEGMLASTYQALLELIVSAMNVGLTFAFLLLPFPIGVYDPAGSSDAWTVPVYTLACLLVVLGAIFFFEGESSDIVDRFLKLGQKRRQLFDDILARRHQLRNSSNLIASVLSKLKKSIEAERGEEWNLLVFNDSLSWRSTWTINVCIFLLYTLTPYFIQYRMFDLDLAKSLAIIGAVRSLPGAVISMLSTIKKFAGGAQYLKEFAELFNLRTAADFHAARQRGQVEFLRKRENEDAAGSRNVLSWESLYREELAQTSQFSHEPEKVARAKGLKGAKITPDDDEAPKVTTTSSTTTTVVDGGVATTTTTVTTVERPVEHTVLRTTVDMRGFDAEYELGGVIAICFPVQEPLHHQLSFLRAIAGVRPESRGLLYLPPYANIACVDEGHKLLPGSLMSNLRISCGDGVDAPSDELIREVCSSVGMHRELVNQLSVDIHYSAKAADPGIPREKDIQRPLKLLGVPGEIVDSDIEVIKLVNELICLPDILVIVNSQRMIKKLDKFARFACALRAFCFIRTAAELALLPAATIELLRRSTDKAGEKEEFLVDAFREAESIPGVTEIDGVTVSMLLNREPTRTVIFPCPGEREPLLPLVHIDKSPWYKEPNRDFHGAVAHVLKAGRSRYFSSASSNASGEKGVSETPVEGYPMSSKQGTLAP